MVMVKSIIAFITVVVIVLFALSNVHHIQLHFITGNPFDVRLIYLGLFSYMIGVLSAAYFFVVSRFLARRKARDEADALTEAEEGF